jgi:hypothetical protein
MHFELIFLVLEIYNTSILCLSALQHLYDWLDILKTLSAFQVISESGLTASTYLFPHLPVKPLIFLLIPLSVQCQIMVPSNNSIQHFRNLEDAPRKTPKLINTHIFTGCGNPYNHSIVFSKSATVPVFVRSPLCSNTSPSGTLKAREWVSLTQTKRVHCAPSRSAAGFGGRSEGVYSRYTTSRGDLRTISRY